MSRIAIVGCGLIGGSLLHALAATRRHALVVIDPDEATRHAVASKGEAAVAARIEDAGLGEAELVILAQPLPALLACFPALHDLSADAIVTDVAGIKAPVLEAARRLPDGVHFVGGHPMAGKERGGYSEARSHLFNDRVVALTPAPGANEAAVVRIEQLWREVGAKPIRCSAEDHDAAVARVSHLPHLVAAALSLVAGQGDELALKLAASGLRDTTRIAEDRTVRHAAALNGSLPALVRETAAELLKLADLLEKGADPGALLDAAAAARKRIFPH